jgi:exonuclease SbcC
MHFISIKRLSSVILNHIHLHNFMSYADATLDLSGISVACLTGLNGAGKSALLDAVTWALWEEARSGSDELVRLGEKEMWVEVVFSPLAAESRR